MPRIVRLNTLHDAILHFADEQACIAYMVRLRWPDGPQCPVCQSKAVTWLPTRSFFQCKAQHPRRQFSVKVGTVFELSPIPLSKWLLTTWMLVNCRNGISSYEVARTIGVTQKTAWFMLHRLRKAMLSDPKHPLFCEVEADETYIGGKPQNKHSRRRTIEGDRKTPVFGMVERGGRVVAEVVTGAREKIVLPIIVRSIAPGSTLYTDSHVIYDKVPAVYDHQRINHEQEWFVSGSIHTNTIENFWSVLKRMLKGTYISVTRKHLTRYVQEQVFRFNHRHGDQFTEEARFGAVLGGIVGKRLTYKELIGRAA